MNQHHSFWTVERDALLAQMWNDGYSAAEIARNIKDVYLTRNAVIGRANRLKLPPRKARAQPPIPSPRKEPRRVRKRQLASIPLPPPPPNPPVMRGLTLLELEPSSCRFPIDDGLFCGAEARGAYCPFHRILSLASK